MRTLRKELMPVLKEEVALVRSQRQALAEPNPSYNKAAVSYWRNGRRGLSDAIPADQGDRLAEARPLVDVVYIVCGVNDWKNFVKTGRLWTTFRQDLEELVTDIKEICGEDCRVVRIKTVLSLLAFLFCKF